MHELCVGTTRDMTSVMTDPLAKGFCTFEHPAHSPMFEEPYTMKRIIRRDVLSGTNTLADGTQGAWAVTRGGAGSISSGT
jgi:hypothetical protein